MRAITDILAAIILVGVAVVIIVSGSYWLLVVGEQATSSYEESRQSALEREGMKIRIENFDSASGILTIKNTGSFPIAAEDIAVFAGENAVDCGFVAGVLGISERITCTVTCMQGEEIKVTAPGNIDIWAC